MRYEYSEKALYNQLLYLSSLFDVDKAKKALGRIGSGMDALRKMRRADAGVVGDQQQGAVRDGKGRCEGVSRAQRAAVGADGFAFSIRAEADGLI